MAGDGALDREAQKEMAIAVLQVAVSKAELKAAKVNIDRRHILAPLNAVVVELSRHEGEWVQPGDPVMRLVRVDLLRVEGFINAKEYQPLGDQEGPAGASGRVASPRSARDFSGKIVYVKPMVEAGGNFLVRAEVENRQQDGVWVLSPGLSAEMTIQLK